MPHLRTFMNKFSSSSAATCVSSLSLGQVILGLERLGEPPKPFQASPIVVDALNTVAALAMHALSQPLNTLWATTPALWRTVLEPWLKALLIHTLIIPNQTTRNVSCDIREDTLWIVPWLLESFIGAGFLFTSTDASSDSYFLTPQLQHLVVRTWRVLSKEPNATWGWWSSLLVLFKHGFRPGLGMGMDLLDGPTLSTFSTGEISGLVLYVASTVERLSDMTDEELAEFAAFMCLFSDIVIKAKLGTVQEVGCCRSVLEKEATGLVHVLAELIRHQRLAKGNDEWRRDRRDCEPNPIMLSVASVLSCILEGPGPVSAFITSGILSTFLRHPEHFPGLTPEVRPLASDLLDSIDRYMFFPSVQRSFALATKRDGSVAPERGSVPSRELVKHWNKCREKALYLSTVRKDLKKDGLLYQCTVAKCTNVQVMKYKCCSRCKAFYCSRTCQKLDWAGGHRARCSASNIGLNQAVQDRQFLCSVVGRYLIDNANDVDEIIHSYAATLREPAWQDAQNDPFLQDTGLVINERKYPVLVVDLNAADMAIPSAWVKAMTTAALDDLLEYCDDIIKVWRTMPASRLFVIALPPSPDGVLVVDHAFSFQLPWPRYGFNTD
ncbi:hypothetical protein V5O48_002441 [Marasmius crinis-equi]|uniref:MYND-type domain-containing protein n=1 Tax=Marasmius crinis-equi TaxID=585013 RepID=A0ABR3FW58_9AGAR